jgi:hypothetical protein
MAFATVDPQKSQDMLKKYENKNDKIPLTFEEDENGFKFKIPKITREVQPNISKIICEERTFYITKTQLKTILNSII